ncbi:hypothetical protein CMU17_02435 [Elizabethkingia anophelis]|nr:hypothetical protein [Elizabethkingia anophelis]MDV3760292.1 hypothetical protein [Elizabethkingia anophelis]
MYLKSLGIIWGVKEKKRTIVILFFCGAGGTIIYKFILITLIFIHFRNFIKLFINKHLRVS